MRKRTARSVWDRVEEALRDAGYHGTQSEAAKLAGVSQAAVSGWTHGYPRMETAVRLSVALNVCVQWLLAETGPKRPGPPMEATAQRLWDIWARVPPEQRGEIVGFAKSLARPIATALS